MFLKVSDFGLSRDVQTKECYKVENTSVELPVRWMSPESLSKWTFTRKTDVVKIIYKIRICQNFELFPLYFFSVLTNLGV